MSEQRNHEDGDMVVGHTTEPTTEEMEKFMEEINSTEEVDPTTEVTAKEVEVKGKRPSIKDLARSICGLGGALMESADKLSPIGIRIKADVRRDHPVCRKMVKIRRAAGAAKEVMKSED